MTSADTTGPGSLKCVALSPPTSSLLAAVEASLREHVLPGDIRRFGDAILVFTEADPAEIRDWLAPLLPKDTSLLVLEFERWSSRGGDIDSRWMLRRGH